MPDRFINNSTVSCAQVLKLAHGLFNALTHHALGERTVNRVDVGLAVIPPNRVVRNRVNLIAEWLFIKGLIEGFLIPRRLLHTLQLHECVNGTVVMNAIGNRHHTYYYFLSCKIRVHTDTSSHNFMNDWNININESFFSP